MPIMMASASSHAPSLFFNTYAGWQKMHHLLNDGHTQPPETELEDEAHIAMRMPQVKANFARLKEEISRFRPDVIISVIGDQREWYDGSNIASLLVYTGPDAFTVHNQGLFDEDPVPNPTSERFQYAVHVDQEMSRKLHADLVEMGFDSAFSEEMLPESQPGRGMPHGIGNVAPSVHPSLGIPVVLVVMNVDDGPPVILNGERCVELGRAIAKSTEDSSKRILITGSGGMSHDPRGLRSGWVDEPQDEWFLEQLREGRIEPLKSMFSFRSELFRGGGGELRTWIVAAAAMDYMKPGHRAAWTDYFPMRKVTTGCGWMYYPPVTLEEIEEARAQRFVSAI